MVLNLRNGYIICPLCLLIHIVAMSHVEFIRNSHVTCHCDFFAPDILSEIANS